MLATMATDPPLPQVLLVVGEEELLVARTVSRVVARAREIDPDADIRDLAGAETSVELLEESLAPSLFGEQRVVVVRGVQEGPKDLHEVIVRYAADPLDATTLVVTHAGGAKGKAVVDGLRAAKAAVVECPKVKWASEREDFVRTEARAAGGRLSNAAVKAVIAAVGNDLRELATAVGQLVADTTGEIDEEVVARYYRGKAEATGFVIADRAVEGDAAGALELLRWGLAVGLAPLLVTSALAGNIRVIAKVAGAGRGPVAALAKRLGLPTWKVERAQRQARGWQSDGLATALACVAEADAAVKGAGADPAYALERAVLGIVAARSA